MLRRPIEFTLRALVGVMNDFLGAALPDRHVHRLQDECGAQMIRHRPANHTATEHVDNDGQIQETRPCGHVGDVGHPEFVRMLRPEISINQIRSRTGIAIPNRRPSPFAAAGALQTGRFHQARHPLPSHVVSGIDQFGMNARDSVGRSGVPMYGLDLGLKFPIGPSTGRWLTIAPRIVPAGGDAQNTAQSSNWIIGLMGSHEFEDPSGIVPVSRANQAAAFDRISRSCFSRRFSRRKRRSSSCSAVVRPSLRWPDDSSACWTQFRIICDDGSNSCPSSSGVRPDRISSIICRRNSGGYAWCLFPIADSLLPKDYVSTKTGQLQTLDKGSSYSPKEPLRADESSLVIHRYL